MLGAEESPGNIGFFEEISSLDKDEKLIITLRFLYDMTLDEISRQTGQNISTVKSRYYRALKRLKNNKEAAVL